MQFAFEKIRQRFFASCLECDVSEILDGQVILLSCAETQKGRTEWTRSSACTRARFLSLFVGERVSCVLKHAAQQHEANWKWQPSQMGKDEIFLRNHCLRQMKKKLDETVVI